MAPPKPTEASPLVASASTSSARPTGSYSVLLKRVAPALLGNMIEFYEFGVYALVTEAITENFFEEGNKIGVWFGFAISFVARPFGGFFFGWIADTISRRTSLLMSVFGMVVSTVCIGLLPTRRCCGSGWGGLGLVLLMLCKVMQGLCVGGELTTVIVFSAEHAGPGLCGFGVAAAVATAAMGTIIAELVVLVLDSFLDSEQMLVWGWRVPFLIVLPWGVLALALRRGLLEPEHSTEAEEHRAVIRELWDRHKRHLFLGTLVFGGQHVGFWGNVIFPKSFLIDAGVRSSTVALAVALCGLMGSLISKPVGGLLCDHLGKPAAARSAMIRAQLFGASQHGASYVAPAFTAISLCLCWPLWVLMVWPGVASLSLVAGFAFGVIDGFLGVSLLLIGLGLFPASVRATGLGLTYNVAHALFSASAPFVAASVWHRWRRPAEPGSLLAKEPWLANTAPAVWPLITLTLTACALLPLLAHARGGGLAAGEPARTKAPAAAAV